MRLLIAFACFALLAPAAMAAPPDCPFEKARYALMGLHDMTLQFLPQAEGRKLTARIVSAQQNLTMNFSLDAGEGGYAEITLKPLPDTELLIQDFEARLYQFDDALGEVGREPMKGEVAADYIFIPELPMTIWYSKAKLRMRVPRTMFHRTGCEG